MTERAFELAPDAVDVWYLFTEPLSDPRLLERSAAVLSTDERVRVQRYVLAKDRRQYTLTHGVLRLLLSRYAGITPEECMFVTNEYGKPSLNGRAIANAAFEFNVSHTNGLVAIAIAIGRDVGIDVEELTGLRVDLDVRRFFSAAEVKALEALPDAEQESRFYDYWTLKEAYVKARGMGLSLPLDGFSMKLEGGQSPIIAFASSIEDDASMWQFAQFDPGPQYRLALAIRRAGENLAVRIRDFGSAGNGT